LLSPVFDLSDYADPHINYSSWFFCLHGAAPDDTLEVYLLNGLGDIELIDQHYNGRLSMSQWHANSIAVGDVMTMTENMQVLFILSDYLETENVTEAAIDYFSVTDFSLVSIETSKQSTVHIYPNPFKNEINVVGIEEGTIQIFDVSGREVANLSIEKTIQLDQMERGTYFFVISDAQGNRVDAFTQIRN